MHSYTGKTSRNKKQHANVDRDLERVTEAGRDSQRNAGSCIEMHRQLCRQRERQRERDKQRQTETDRDRQRQTETDRDRDTYRDT